jgi:hypothetical protein
MVALYSVINASPSFERGSALLAQYARGGERFGGQCGVSKCGAFEKHVVYDGSTGLNRDSTAGDC